MNNKKTLVLGASPNPARYSYLAINQLRSKGHEVIAIGKHNGKVGDIQIETEEKPIENLYTITLYLSAHNQKNYNDFIYSQNPKRTIFNPGDENEDHAAMAKKEGVVSQEACKLVLLSTG